MKELIITQMQEGQRLEHLLERYLNRAPKSFLYRMLRKKNITLNGKKATGKETLQEGDAVRLWFSDETLEKFTGQDHSGGQSTGQNRSGQNRSGQGRPQQKKTEKQTDPDFTGRILYEDEHILIFNKPAGMLTQKASPDDRSLNEEVIDYLLETHQTDEEKLASVRPSVCNRLDRNTSGIVTVGKSYQGLRILTSMFHDRSVRKDYLCIVEGCVSEEMTLTGFLEKDSSRNMARVFADGPENMQPVSETARRIETGIRPVRSWTDRSGTQLSLLEIHLITGRSHQIRAHLSSIGHPIIGDVKYGNASLNRRYLSECGVQSQLLHAYRLTFPDRVDEPLSGLSGKVVTADPPPAFLRTGRMNCGR